MKKTRLFLKLIIYLIFMISTGISALYLYAFITPKDNVKIKSDIMIYDINEELIIQGSSNNEWVKLDDISPYLKNAVISIEDKKFYNHLGFDYLRIIKALYLNFFTDKPTQGASTISQQYIKNIYLDFTKSWKRKIQEAFLTLELEVHYTKDEILEGYLNTINYGQGNYGISSASYYYFAKKPSELTLEESIILAGIPKSPNNYNPISNFENSKKRGLLVAKSMLKNNYISEQDYNKINFSNLKINIQTKEKGSKTLMYYQDSVMNELKKISNIPDKLLYESGLKIYTNFDPLAQQAIDNAIKNNQLKDDMEIATLIINPSNGAIVALAGGKNYSISQFNRALNAKRQVGSAMKPILYYAALENNMVSSSTFLSEPTTFVFSNNKTYSPSNYNDIYAFKDITMAAAVCYSDNIYAVKTHLFLGEDVLVSTAKRMGIKEELKPNPSLALGTSEMTMIDFANAYATLANEGFYNDLHFINKIEDQNGNVIYRKKDSKNLVLNQNYVYIINELLTTTYNSAFFDYSSPTMASITSKISRKYAIKSGSTNSDFWVVGYNKNYLVMVWNGKDDSSSLEVKDSKATKNIWVDIMESVQNNSNKIWYETPKNIVGIPLNGITGKSGTKNNLIFYYEKGSEPITK